jgi:hypothetical protein
MIALPVSPEECEIASGGNGSCSVDRYIVHTVNTDVAGNSIGLTFVRLTLVSDMPRQQTYREQPIGDWTIVFKLPRGLIHRWVFLGVLVRIPSVD